MVQQCNHLMAKQHNNLNKLCFASINQTCFNNSQSVTVNPAKRDTKCALFTCHAVNYNYGGNTVNFYV